MKFGDIKTKALSQALFEMGFGFFVGSCERVWEAAARRGEAPATRGGATGKAFCPQRGQKALAAAVGARGVCGRGAVWCRAAGTPSGVVSPPKATYIFASPFGRGGATKLRRRGTRMRSARHRRLCRAYRQRLYDLLDTVKFCTDRKSPEEVADSIVNI